MQTELLNTRKTVVELIAGMEVWVDCCNGNGWHSYSGYMGPGQYEVLRNDPNKPLLFT